MNQNNRTKKPDNQRIQQLRMLICDIDGVLTDGRIYVNESGEYWKSTNIKDGMGLRLWLDSGRIPAILSAGFAPGVRLRFERIGVKEFQDRILDKAAVCHELIARYELRPEQVAFIGDDLVDIPAFNSVGMAICPYDAVPEIVKRADWVTTATGGAGVIREIVDTVLKAAGEWDQVVGQWLQSASNSEAVTPRSPDKQFTDMH